MDKKKLELILSRLREFNDGNVKLEQYLTDVTIVADVLWNAYNEGDIEERMIADLGCGTGLFGLGALVLGARKVYFVDVDSSVLKVAKENKKFLEKFLKKKLNCCFLNVDVSEFSKKVDVVLENPPFGVKKEHADKEFLEVAFECADTVYSFHKFSTKKFVERFSEDNKFKVGRVYRYKFPIKKSFSFHRKKVETVDVGCWRLIKFIKTL
jgi:putative methylase